MAQKKITDLQLRSDADATINIPVDDASQTWRVTGAQLKAFIVPFTTLGDWLYGGASGAPTRLAGNTTTTMQIPVQTGNGSVSAAPTLRDFKAPTIQKFTSGSGTYTTPAGVMYIRVRAIGGGGGSSGTGSASGGTGGTGGTTTFGSSLISCVGGSGGVFASNGGAGGTASLGTGPIGTAITGGRGQSGGAPQSSVYCMGGMGASSPFAGGGAGGGATNLVGIAGGANTGTGGGGYGSNTTNHVCGSGGGAGGFVDALIASPDATYAYAVGAAGTAGTAGTGGNVGLAGGSGYIEVTEYYQ